MAMLDALLSRDWESRLYSFNSRWAEGEQMGSMRNGQGDDFFALFNARGCFLKGFAHEAPMSPYRTRPRRLWTGILDSVPEEFAACLSQPAFGMEDTTFCVWRRYGDAAWGRGSIDFPSGPDPDGSEYLLSPLDGNPATHRDRAARYFNKPFLTAEMVRHVYEHRPLSDRLVAAFNPKRVFKNGANPHPSVADLADDVAEIGYPM